jgi:hypothetical protein
MSRDTVLKFAAWGVYVMVVLQVVFHVVFHVIGYHSLLLSITLLASVVVVLIVFGLWRFLKKGS